jgi:hypothetical protein
MNLYLASPFPSPRFRFSCRASCSPLAEYSFFFRYAQRIPLPRFCAGPGTRPTGPKSVLWFQQSIILLFPCRLISVLYSLIYFSSWRIFVPPSFFFWNEYLIPCPAIPYYLVAWSLFLNSLFSSICLLIAFPSRLLPCSIASSGWATKFSRM